MNEYPLDWPEIAQAVKVAADWKCVRCKAPNSRIGWRVLTVHHLDDDKSNCRWWNLVALCQRCHLSVQGRVVLAQPYFFEHSVWFRPYAAGYYAWKYLHQDLSREEVAERMEELLTLERIA